MGAGTTDTGTAAAERLCSSSTAELPIEFSCTSASAALLTSCCRPAALLLCASAVCGKLAMLCLLGCSGVLCDDAASSHGILSSTKASDTAPSDPSCFDRADLSCKGCAPLPCCALSAKVSWGVLEAALVDWSAATSSHTRATRTALVPSVLRPSSSRAERNCATLYRLSSAGVYLVPACSSLRMLSRSWLLLCATGTSRASVAAEALTSRSVPPVLLLLSVCGVCCKLDRAWEVAGVLVEDVAASWTSTVISGSASIEGLAVPFCCDAVNASCESCALLLCWVLFDDVGLLSSCTLCGSSVSTSSQRRSTKCALRPAVLRPSS